MKTKWKIGGLLFKAILALSLVSIVPVVLISWHVLYVDSHILQSEILGKQRSIAHRIALSAAEEIDRKIQFFSVFTELHTDFEGHPLITQSDINHLHKYNTEIIYLAVLDNTGKLRAFSGPAQERETIRRDGKVLLQPYLAENKPYSSTIQHINDQLYLRLIFPLRKQYRDTVSSGLLIVNMDLDGLEKLLLTAYPDDISTIVVDGKGNLISYAGPKGRWVGDTDKTDLQWRDLVATAKEVTSSQIKLGNGERVLVSSVQIPTLNWRVYVQQPARTLSKLAAESLFVSPWDVLLILLGLAIFVTAVGYWVLMPIIRPVQRLQEVAIRFDREDDYVPTEKDLIIPDNEIGNLIHVFLHMVQVLFERKEALRGAQQKLSSMNKELERRVEERTAELHTATNKLVKAEQLAAIGQMASIISHEIRNPLAVISNAARLLKAIQPPADPKAIKQFAIIDAEIRQANGIIGEVLGFARSRDMILSTIDLNSYLHDIVASFPITHNVRIGEELDPESVLLKIDAEEIKQAIRNLISNACEAMPQGGKVTVGTRVGKHVVCIYVGDEGPGLSEEVKAKIFSPFFTTKARGTGLGLAVVQKAVARHRGKIYVRSAEGKGTLFQMYLKIYNKSGDTRYVG